METIEIIKVKNGETTLASDLVAQEIPFTILVNGQELVTLQASPAQLKELAVGFLYGSGLIASATDVEELLLDERRWLADISVSNKELPLELLHKRVYTSGCGKGTLFATAIEAMSRRRNLAQFTIDKQKIMDLMAAFNALSDQFKDTGGVHSAALCDGENILYSCDDIGRHNAADKVIGHMLLSAIEPAGKLLLLSGRISSEIVLKANHAGIAMVVSRSAPTNQGVRHARDIGLTLLGFVRGQRMNIYSGEQRIG